jgi:ABC-type multidrug transport system fused ATPase/permease subunit
MALAVGLLFVTVGLATVPGLALILCTIALNAPLARSLQRCQSRFMEAQDRRLRATTELLHSIKVLKLQAWEDRFRLRLDELRGDELRWLSRMQSRRSLGTILYWLSPVAVSSVVFAACIWSGRALDATTVFTVLASFRIIQDPVRMVPEVLAAYIQVVVSLARLQKFLDDDELPPAPPRCDPASLAQAPDDDDDDEEEDASAAGVDRHADHAAACDAADRFVIRCRGCSFSWNAPEAPPPPPTLKGIDLGIKAGQKIAVCGVVGAGKSSLISALLGEIPKLSGSVSPPSPLSAPDHQ